ncbi:glycosyl hydrolases family 31-domain-containing protein [Bombardia bombarda]|uniref:alpha-D-xyloside xylohydrolase n=1 Tax=Bombardia bombarda TaxID=252184 RepID=A0AA40C5L2_9PEZI|nr:glycosyl hydrolases family 31-domain-containing protein [Bombardia bombarda]
MRFRDGQWLVAEGMRVEYAEEVYRITETETPAGKGLSLLCPSKKIMTRGDVLNLSSLSIVCFLPIVLPQWPAPDSHPGHRTRHPRRPLRHHHPLARRPPSRPQLRPLPRRPSRLNLLHHQLRRRHHPHVRHPLRHRLLHPHDFAISFHPSHLPPTKHLTTLLNRSVGLAYSPATSNPLQTADMRNLKHYIFTQTTLGVGESVHGLGERFGAFNKVGQQVNLWNADGGTSSDQAYKNISFWMSSRGYGIFIDTPERVELEIGSERCCRVQTSVEGQRLRWYIIYGPTPKEVLERYSILTGKPGGVPGWSFGLWLSTSFTTSYDEGTVNSFLEGMKERDIPVEVFHFDCFWLRAFQWCDFVFDEDMFPDPKGQISRLKASGMVKKVCVWTNPYLGQASPVFKEAVEKGYLLKRKNGDVFQWDLWQTGMGIVDFTNPAACGWFVSCLERLFDMGVDSIKTDFGERIPHEDVQWFDTAVDPKRMHNYYAFIYNKLVYETLQKRYGADEAVLFARTATAGTQRFPLTWGGDCESTPEAMAESIRGGLSLGLSGFAFWSVDIGGFEGYPAPWIYKRWVAFGLLCSHSRLHGSNSYRVPWTVDEDDKGDEGCSATLAKWTHLKARLMPYIFAQAQDSIRRGLPLSLRAMCIEFPEDPTSWTLDSQFMLGESLLVAPVFEEDGDVQFYLPKGRWTNFFTGEVKSGPGWAEERHSFATLPLYVREGTLLVLGREGERRTVYDYTEAVEVRTYFAVEGTKAVLVDSEGAEVGVLEVGKGGEVKGQEKLKGESVVKVTEVEDIREALTRDPNFSKSKFNPYTNIPAGAPELPWIR